MVGGGSRALRSADGKPTDSAVPSTLSRAGDLRGCGRDRLLDLCHRGCNRQSRLRMRLLEQPVSDAPDVHDEAVVVRELELLPEARRVRLERARPPEGAEAPDLAQELLLREHAVRLRREP